MNSSKPPLTNLFIYIALIAILLEPAYSLGAKKNHGSKNRSINKSYGQGFYNHSGCLYAHVGGGQFQMVTADGFKINETLDLGSLEFDTSKTRCSSAKQAAKLSFTFKLNGNKRVSSFTVSMKIISPDSYGYWEVSQANLTVTRSDIERKRTFPLVLPGIYAGRENSYSCNGLSLSTTPKRKVENETKADPLANINIRKFQLQPFAELEQVVFATSNDCSSWMTIPGFMGLVLILFMLFVTIMGIVLLKNIVTNDFKFNKEGLLFTQSQMETNKNR